MKLVRPLLVTFGILLALLVLSAGVALLPSVQQWAVRRTLAQHPELKLAFASLSLGPTSARLSGVRFERDGLVVTAERAEAEFSAWQFLLRRHVRIDRLLATGIAIDAAKLPAARTPQAAGAPVAAPGALARVQLPYTVQIGEVQIAGRATLPAGPGRAPLVADFQLTGGGIAPGQEGALLLRASLLDATPGAVVNAVRVDGRLAVRETVDRAFDRASLVLTLNAEGPQLSHAQQLKLAAGMESAGGREQLTLALDTQQNGQSATLLKISATLPTNAPEGAGTWELHATTAQIEPFFLGRALPKFDASGAGKFSFNAQTRAAMLQGQLAGNLAALEALEPSLRAIGAVRVQSEFDIAVDRATAHLNRLQLKVDGEQPVLAVETTQPLVLTLGQRALQLAAAGTGPLARISVTQLPLAWIRPFVAAADVSGGTIRGEWLLQGQGDTIELRSTAPLKIDALTVVQGGRRVLDRAELSLQSRATLTPASLLASVESLALRTPAGDVVSGEAQVELPGAKTEEIIVRGKFTADAPRLLEPVLPLGHVQLKGDIDATLTPELVELRGFHGELADAKGRPLLGAASVQASTFDLQAMRLKTAASGETAVARLTIGAMDFAALPLVQAIAPLRGTLQATTFNLTVNDGRVFLKPAAPLRFQDVTLLGETRQPTLDRITIETSPTLEYASFGDWRLASGETKISNRDQTIWFGATAEVKATPADGVRASATFNADLAAMAAQPPFVAAQVLASGRASGEIRGALAGKTVQIEGRTTLNNLVLREGNQPLPVANFNFRAARTPDKRLTFEAPILLDRLGQRSDLTITADAVRRADGFLFDAKIAGEHLELADALALLGLAGAPVQAAGGDSATRKRAPTNGTAAVRPVEPDARPFWTGLRGELTLDVKSITRGKDWAMTGLSGFVVIDPQRVAVQQLQGIINEKSRLGARIDLRFNGGATPYHLSGNFSLTDFDAGAFIKAFDPGKPPTLEGIVTVAGGFTGDGANLDHVIDRTRGQFQLTSRQGVFRGLKRTSEKVSVATKAVDAVAALGSLFGSDKVKGAAEKVAGQSYQVDQLAQSLAEIPFDQLVVRVNRDDALNLRVDEFTLLSPEVRLLGKGTITHVANKPLLEQPLAVNYTLAARGKTEQLLGKMRVLDGTKDDLGYSKMKDVGTIGGTLSRPDPSQLFIKLAQSKLADFLN
ncbi:MAG: hypothetical protein HYV96_02625 [Opitutae bacterium]|nr:hypothetical protein [Opitutae bacterium]